METEHCHFYVIHDDTQDHVSFKCMLHTLAGSSRLLYPEDVGTRSFEMSGIPYPAAQCQICIIRNTTVITPNVELCLSFKGARVA